MNKSNWLALLAVVVLILAGFWITRSVYFGTATNTYVPPQRDLTEVSVEQAALSARMEAVETPTAAKGLALVDFSHDNALFVEELNTLFSKLVSRGYDYQLVTPVEDEKEDPTLIDQLPMASALVLPLPRQSYSTEEITEIEKFVKNGGRLLIIGDPTRTVEVDALNSVAGSFGMIYADDYLYSLNRGSMDNNYRNVIYTKFNNSPLTDGLADGDKVIFYSGSSINAPGHEVILGDEFTHSSTSEGGRTMAAAALTADDRVLALGDLTFFNEPYSAAESNGTLINNIATFLTGGQRSYELKDFPNFFNDNIDVVFDNTLVFNSQFEDSVKMKELLEQHDHTVNFVDEIGPENDVIFVGRFDDTEMVQDYLDAVGIVILDPVPADEEEIAVEAEATAEEVSDAPEAGADQTDPDADQDFVEGRIQIEGVGELERGGSTLFYRHQVDDRNLLIILSDNPDTNADAFALLMDNQINECLVGSNIAVCQTEDPSGKQPPSIRSTRIDKILVVSDDSGRAREDKQTSAIEFDNVLSDTYKTTTWVTSDDGAPELAELQEYDAVIWSTGDYWDDSISAENAETLTAYIEAGGNLILSGASIAFDWDHTDFLQNIVHADYQTFAEQADIELALEDHPIARDFEPGTVVDFVDTPSGEPVLPDAVGHTEDARVIFNRGPASEQSGAAAVIAYEDDRSKIAYYAFPIYLLPGDAQSLLVNNTVDWFSRKPLDLPDKDKFEPFAADEDTSAKEKPKDGEENGNGENGEQTGEDTGNNDENSGTDNSESTN